MAHKVPQETLQHCPLSSTDNGDRTSGDMVCVVNGVSASASATVVETRYRCLAEDIAYTREGHSAQGRRKGRDRRHEEEKRIEDWTDRKDKGKEEKRRKGRDKHDEERKRIEDDWRERNDQWGERKNKDDLWKREKRERRENQRETRTGEAIPAEWRQEGDRTSGRGRRDHKEEVGREEGHPGEEEEEECLEGQKEGEVRRSEGSESCGSGASVEMAGGSACDVERDHELVNHGMVTPLHQADHGIYTSDEWEESGLSDSQDDHSDSSDDDDPKSQVDRLIEQVTLVYLDGENSNLSSESEDYDDSDSESDITDVSPLVSATASPLGLSPVLPRRTLGTSPLALHDNRTLGFNYGAEIGTAEHNYELQVPTERHSKSPRPFTSQDPSDMTVLLKAVVELEENQRREQNRARNDTPAQDITPHPSSTSHHPRRSPPMAIHPIDASPHHRHLRRAAGHRRKNMSFPNEEVRRIDRENQMLLEKIMSTHSRTSTRHHHHHHHHHSQSTSSSSSTQSYPSHHSHHHSHHHRPVHRPANSTINRRREEEKIRRENMILLRRIQEAKPSREVTAFRSSRHHRSPHSLTAAPGSCGASARTAPGHVAATATRRKETAL